MKALIELFLAHRHSREAWDPTQANLGAERRVFDRVAYKAACRLNNPLFGLESEGQTVNLSMGGMGVYAPVSWPEGSQIKVSFDVLSLDGLVVYRQDANALQQEARYGIKFQKLGLGDLLKLRQIINRRQA